MVGWGPQVSWDLLIFGLVEITPFRCEMLETPKWFMNVWKWNYVWKWNLVLSMKMLESNMNQTIVSRFFSDWIRGFLLMSKYLYSHVDFIHFFFWKSGSIFFGEPDIITGSFMVNLISLQENVRDLKLIPEKKIAKDIVGYEDNKWDWPPSHQPRQLISSILPANDNRNSVYSPPHHSWTFYNTQFRYLALLLIFKNPKDSIFPD